MRPGKERTEDDLWSAVVPRRDDRGMVLSLEGGRSEVDQTDVRVVEKETLGPIRILHERRGGLVRDDGQEDSGKGRTLGARRLEESARRIFSGLRSVCTRCRLCISARAIIVSSSAKASGSPRGGRSMHRLRRRGAAEQNPECLPSGRG